MRQADMLRVSWGCCTWPANLFDFLLAGVVKLRPRFLWLPGGGPLCVLGPLGCCARPAGARACNLDGRLELPLVAARQRGEPGCLPSTEQCTCGNAVAQSLIFVHHTLSPGFNKCLTEFVSHHSMMQLLKFVPWQVRALLRAGDLAGLAAGDELTRMRRQVACPLAPVKLCTAPCTWQVSVAGLITALRQCHVVLNRLEARCGVYLVVDLAKEHAAASLATIYSRRY